MSLKVSKNPPLWVYNPSRNPPSFLPVGLDESCLVEVSTSSDSFAKFVDRRTGRIHDGAEYYARDIETLRSEDANHSVHEG